MERLDAQDGQIRGGMQVNVELQIEIDLTCSECGATLFLIHDGNRRGTECFKANPCKDCLEEAKEKGRDEVKVSERGAKQLDLWG